MDNLKVTLLPPDLSEAALDERRFESRTDEIRLVNVWLVLGKKTTIMLPALVGLFLGIIAALFVEFAAKTREEAARRAESV